jgi:hypothetical protein
VIHHAQPAVIIQKHIPGEVLVVFLAIVGKKHKATASWLPKKENAETSAGPLPAYLPAIELLKKTEKM